MSETRGRRSETEPLEHQGEPLLPMGRVEYPKVIRPVSAAALDYAGWRDVIDPGWYWPPPGAISCML